MDVTDIHPLQVFVSWASIGFVFVFVVQQSHFCTLVAISAILNTDSWTRMRTRGTSVVAASMSHTPSWLLLFSDAPYTFPTGAASIVGLARGLSSLLRLGVDFRWQGFRSTQDMALQVLDAVVAGPPLKSRIHSLNGCHG